MNNIEKAQKEFIKGVLCKLWDFWENTEVTLENIFAFIPFLDLETKNYYNEKEYHIWLHHSKGVKLFENKSLWGCFEELFRFITANNISIKGIQDDN